MSVEDKLRARVAELEARLAAGEALLRDWRHQSGTDAFFLTREPGPRARGVALQERTSEFLAGDASR